MKLESGALSATLDSLGLRWLRWHDTELLRGVGFVLRDADWGTLQPEVEQLAQPDGVLLRGRLASPRLHCELRIAVAPDRITLQGCCTPQAEFVTNRTGFVVLHPESCAGAPVEIEHPRRVSHGHFPGLISPHQPFRDIRAIATWPLPGLRVRTVLDGDTFEMEDHRNWSDAGFKTYSRPLAAPRPFVIRPGKTLRQSVRIEVAWSGGTLRIARGAPAEAAADLPDDADLLLAETADGADLGPFARRLQATGRPGAVLLAGHGDRAAALGRIAAAAPGIEALLIADATAEDVARARAVLPKVRIGAGSAEHFAELNRRPPPPGVDLVFWGVSATVHAADDDSVRETLRVLADQARTARARFGDLPLWIGPIGIGPRWTADRRDGTALGAAFRRGHLAAWAAADAELVILPHLR